MGWVCGRKATDEDYEALDKAARRFMDRHGLANEVPGEIPGVSLVKGYWGQLEDHIGYLRFTCDPYEKYFSRLWLRCLRRALNDSSAEGIAWDTVGYHVD